MIKGGSRGSPGNLAGHLLRTDTNEEVELVELTGVASSTLLAALSEMAAVATGTRCVKPLYHASLNSGPGELLTRERQSRALAVLEARLGLSGHARAVVAHRKAGRDHLHVVWSRIDLATMQAVHDGFNYRAHEEVARQLEREFGHQRVQGVHVERQAPDGSRTPRPVRTPPTAELQQAARTKRDPAAITTEITQLWRMADSGKAFAAALHEAGYVLARGDKRGYCLLDPDGGVHSLARRLEGVTTKAVNTRLADIPLASLPSVAAARDQLRQRAAVPAQPPERQNLPPIRSTGPRLDRLARDQPASGGGVAGQLLRAAGTVLRGLFAAGGGGRAGAGRRLGKSPSVIPADSGAIAGRLAFIPGGRGPPSPRTPPKGRQTMKRPFARSGPALGVPQEVIAWAMEAKRKLIGYSDATGEYVVPELEHLSRILSGAYLDLGLTVIGQQRQNAGPAP